MLAKYYRGGATAVCRRRRCGVAASATLDCRIGVEPITLLRAFGKLVFRRQVSCWIVAPPWLVLQRVDARRRSERQRSRPETATGVSEFLRAVRGSPDIRSIVIPGRSVLMFRQRSKPLASNFQTGEASELFCTDVNSASVRVVSVEMRVEAAPVTAEWECDAPWEA